MGECTCRASALGRRTDSKANADRSGARAAIAAIRAKRGPRFQNGNTRANHPSSSQDAPHSTLRIPISTLEHSRAPPPCGLFTSRQPPPTAPRRSALRVLSWQRGATHPRSAGSRPAAASWCSLT
eukprot:scaffold18337_cov95-Isochrysis_galbana.AAC.3